MSELPISRDAIREIFSTYGFNIVEGTADIDPDAYALAEELFKAALSKSQAAFDELAKLSSDYLEESERFISESEFETWGSLGNANAALHCFLYDHKGRAK